MPGILSLLAIVSFGIIAVIAEGKPSSPKRLNRNTRKSLSHR